jgi:hypothetical protein
MKPETTGIDLMAAAERTLAREVAPALSGDARFKVLMVASALRMVMRELAAADAIAEVPPSPPGSGRVAMMRRLGCMPGCWPMRCFAVTFREARGPERSFGGAARHPPL